MLNDHRYDGRRDPASRARTSAAARRASTRRGRCSRWGCKAIIAPSFADIFRNNCAKIGLLTVELPQDSIDRLIARAEDSPGYEMEVDLETQTVSLGNGKSRHFDIDPFVKHCLLNGLDDIGLTLQEGDAIDAFEAKRSELLPSTAGAA